ncbi:MAG: STAS domain-containing protein [Acidimicrobiaceae bacterium]|nr:STAS domain-containing protein [Acidimicrobiaceae bacterium]
MVEARPSPLRDVAKLVVNLSGVTFLDSTGLCVLVRTANELTDHGGAIRVVASHPPVGKAFEIAGLICDLGVCSTLEQALSA